MRLLSPLLRQVVYPSLRSAGCFRGRGSRLPAVITYHGVMPKGFSRDDIPDGPLLAGERLRAQFRVLKKNYDPIHPEEFLRWVKYGEPLPGRAVLLTCDDGLLNHQREMLPILQEESLHCIFFVTGHSLSEMPRMLWYVELYLMLRETRTSRMRFVFDGKTWDEPLGNRSQRRALWLRLVAELSELDEPARKAWMQQASTELGLTSLAGSYLADPALRSRFALMGKSELTTLRDAGMTIGAHTVSHPILAKQSLASAEQEIGEARQALTNFLDAPVWAMAYPFGYPGSASPREFELVKRAGYECAFLNYGGPVAPDSPRFALPRIHITNEMELAEFEAHLSGFHGRLSEALRGA